LKRKKEPKKETSAQNFVLLRAFPKRYSIIKQTNHFPLWDNRTIDWENRESFFSLPFLFKEKEENGG